MKRPATFVSTLYGSVKTASREDSLSRVVEKLNTFEAVNIVEEDKTLVVR